MEADVLDTVMARPTGDRWSMCFERTDPRTGCGTLLVPYDGAERFAVFVTGPKIVEFKAYDGDSISDACKVFGEDVSPYFSKA